MKGGDSPVRHALKENKHDRTYPDSLKRAARRGADADRRTPVVGARLMGRYASAYTVRPRKTKYPRRACPECGSTATWYKSPRRIYCRQCKHYRALFTAEYAGNAAWRALDANNGTYLEEWGDDATLFDEQAQRELLAICDALNAAERAAQKTPNLEARGL